MAALKKVGKIQLGATTVDVWSDIKALEKQVRRFGKQGVDRAQMRALNRAANKTKTATGRLLSKSFNIKVGDLKPFLKVSPKARMGEKTEVAIMGRSAMLGIFKYAKGTKRQGPLGVKFNSGSGMKLHKHTFLARMPSGHHGVFVRAHKTGSKRVPDISRTTGKPIQKQLPIRELTYPSVAHMVTNVQRGKQIFELFVEDYPKQLFSQLDFEQKKSRGVR
jgi:hypothetical protein